MNTNHYTYHCLMGIAFGKYLVDFFEIHKNRFVVRIWEKEKLPFYLSKNEASLQSAVNFVEQFVRGKLLPPMRTLLLPAKQQDDGWVQFQGTYHSCSFSILRIGSENDGIFEYVLKVPVGVNYNTRELEYRDIYEKTNESLSLDFLIDISHVLIDEFLEAVRKNDSSLYRES